MMLIIYIICADFSLPPVNVYIPRDKLTKDHQGFGFVEWKSPIDADYACKILHQIKLFGKPVRVNKVRSHYVTTKFILKVL